MVYLSQGWKDEARGKHCAPEGAQCKRREELNILSHCFFDEDVNDLTPRSYPTLVGRHSQTR